MKCISIIKQVKARSLLINITLMFIWCLLWDVLLFGEIENSSSNKDLIKRIGQAVFVGTAVTLANTYQKLKEEEIEK